MNMVPRKMFLTKGVGKQRKLTSFELALRNAGIAHFNFVSMSSIFPPKCKLITKKRSFLLSPGQIVFTVLSRNSTNSPTGLLPSVGVAIPKDKEQYGYLSEHRVSGRLMTAGITLKTLPNYACNHHRRGVRSDSSYDTKKKSGRCLAR